MNYLAIQLVRQSMAQFILETNCPSSKTDYLSDGWFSFSNTKPLDSAFSALWLATQTRDSICYNRIYKKMLDCDWFSARLFDT